MRKSYTILFCFIHLFLFSQQKEIPFPNSITAEKAFILQKETKKPILFFFYTNWCKYCFTMKKNTFTNNDVIELIDENFHFVVFNAEGKTPVKIKNKTFENKSGVHELASRLASKNGYMSYPSLVILNHKNRIDEQVDTFLSAQNLKELLSIYTEKKSKRKR